MNPKILIIIAVSGILGLTIFNMVISHKTAKAIQADAPTATVTTPTNTTTNNTAIGLQPKATLDKANNQIAQANAETNAKMAQVDNAGGAK